MGVIKVVTIRHAIIPQTPNKGRIQDLRVVGFQIFNLPEKCVKFIIFLNSRGKHVKFNFFLLSFFGGGGFQEGLETPPGYALVKQHSPTPDKVGYSETETCEGTVKMKAKLPPSPGLI